jgi:hypothetical protein
MGIIDVAGERDRVRIGRVVVVVEQPRGDQEDAVYAAAAMS